MTTAEIATRLVAHCRAHTEAEGLETLYHPDAVSVEAMVPEGMDPVTQGLEGIRGKHAWWNAAMEVHGASVDGPYVNGDRFSVIFEIDATDRNTAERMQMKEVGLYFVEDGRIVREEFQAKPTEG